jgi:2-phospho-L-lactate guanylyltransferase
MNMVGPYAALDFGPRAVLIPIKAFTKAKLRLSEALNPDQRADLARKMSHQVLRAAGDLPVAVVCDDREVAAWARDRGALVIWEPGRGLNGAVEAGVRRLSTLGVTKVIVAHGDLARATELGWVADFEGITLVPDRNQDGTNVIGLPPDSGFVFSYGPGSFARHLDEARRTGLATRVVRGSDLQWDIDLPADLDGLPDAAIGSLPTI